MRCLLDTHLLIWAASEPDNLSQRACQLIEDADNELFFSVASIWETAIKTGMRRPDFRVDARLLRKGLLGAGYREISVSGAHAVAIDTLPPIHKDPFDRLLIAQAIVEEFRLITADSIVARYPGPITLVA